MAEEHLLLSYYYTPVNVKWGVGQTRFLTEKSESSLPSVVLLSDPPQSENTASEHSCPSQNFLGGMSDTWQNPVPAAPPLPPPH